MEDDMSAKHMKKPHVSGFTVCVLVMFLSTVAYILYQSWFFTRTGSFLPMEVTYGFFAVYCFETVSLARLSIAKQRIKNGESNVRLPEKGENPMLQSLGLYSGQDFEAEVQELQMEGNNNELGGSGA